MLRKLASGALKDFRILRKCQLPFNNNQNADQVFKNTKNLDYQKSNEKKSEKLADRNTIDFFSQHNITRTECLSVVNYLKEYKKKEKKTCDKPLDGEFLLWLTGVLGVSSVILTHKWSYELNRKEEKCTAKNVLEKISQNPFFGENVVVGVNVLPRELLEKSESVKKEIIDDASVNQDIENDEVFQKFEVVANECCGVLLNRLANQYSKENESEKAFKLFVKGASYDHAPSLFNLALCYEYGRGTETSIEQALKYYKLAADKGHVKAMFNLATYNLKGLEEIQKVFLTEDERLKYLKMAADQGLEKAQLYLAQKCSLEKHNEESFTPHSDNCRKLNKTSSKMTSEETDSLILQHDIPGKDKYRGVDEEDEEVISKSSNGLRNKKDELNDRILKKESCLQSIKLYSEVQIMPGIFNIDKPIFIHKSSSFPSFQLFRNDEDDFIENVSNLKNAKIIQKSNSLWSFEN